MATDDDDAFVSPYLRQPLRSFEEALRDRAKLSSIRETAARRARSLPTDRRSHAGAPQNGA